MNDPGYDGLVTSASYSALTLPFPQFSQFRKSIEPQRTQRTLRNALVRQEKTLCPQCPLWFKLLPYLNFTRNEVPNRFYA